MTNPTHASPALPSAPQPFDTDHQRLLAATHAFLDGCQAALAQPDRVAEELRRTGWRESDVAIVVDRYRNRFERHALGYSALFFSIGFSALAAGSVAHHVIDRLGDRGSSPVALAFWLTILVVAVPFAAWAWTWSTRTEAAEPTARWSGTRRSLATALLWCCGIVGGIRLLHYLFGLMAELVGAEWFGSGDPVVGLLHVATTTAITFPLGTWAFRLNHARS